MYNDYWHLERNPFENDSDPAFFYAGRSHEAAFLKLQFLVEQSKGVALLVGGHGLGKTCVTRALEHRLEERYRPIVRLMFPRLSAADTLAYLATGLGADPQGLMAAPISTVWRSLESCFTRLAAEGKRPVFLIDDAHLIESPDVLESLAILLNLSDDRGLHLSVALVGQPQLLPQVQRVSALDERIAVRIGLHPLDLEETTGYIAHRLQVAGLKRDIFPGETLSAIANLSRGVPRRINQICDLALLVGYADGLAVISPDEVTAAADELCHVSLE